MASVSFEVFPPRTPEGEVRLWSALDRLAPLDPSFVSVTCGAGGSATDATLDVLRAMSLGSALPAAGHLTCVGRSRARSTSEIVRYWDCRASVTSSRCAGTCPSWRRSRRSRAATRARSSWSTRSGGSRRSRSASRRTRSRTRTPLAALMISSVLARKADAGATRAITQFCFETDAIVRLRERVDRRRDRAPGRAGDHARHRTSRRSRGWRAAAGRASRTGSRRASPALRTTSQTRKLVAAIVAAEQVEELRREGFEGVSLLHSQPGRPGRRRCAGCSTSGPRKGARAA